MNIDTYFLLLYNSKQKNLYLLKATKKKGKRKPKQGFIFDAASQLKVVEMK